ncbi:MAG: FkbM family methyltransferase [Pseudomonadota bacterium]
MGMVSRARKLLRLLVSKVYFKGLLKRVAAAVEHDSVIDFIQPRTVVDIGANRGQFALMVRKVCPDARIYSFEPLPGPADRYERLFESDDQASLFRKAIGEVETTMRMNVSMRDDSSSLLPITEEQISVFPGTGHSGTLDVQVAPLSSALEEEDIQSRSLLKLDVQGYELEVLKGCATLLGRFDEVYVECSFIELYGGQSLASDIIAFLSGQQFNLVGVFNMTFDASKRPIQADFLFSRSRVFESTQ